MGEFAGPTCLCEAHEETCNEVDDDCDGRVDEDLVDCCAPGETRACGSSVGACLPGTETCLGGGIWGACEGAIGPAPELCDGVDNDCDPTTADGAEEPTLGAACDGPDGDVCREGSVLCEDAVLTCSDDTSTNDETCNAIDDDCDGRVDEELLGCCAPDETRACGSSVGACLPGTETCLGGGIWGACEGALGPTPELCDGIDNDCNPATPDGSGELMMGQECDGPDTDTCRTGAIACVAGALSCGGDIEYHACDRGCFATGLGTPGDPYIIDTNERLDRMRWCMSGNFALGADLDLAGTCPLAARDPSVVTLSGSFDGREHTVANMMCSIRRPYVGFVPQIASSGTVRNVHFANATMIGGHWLGTVAGTNYGTIRNVTVSGIVQVADDPEGINAGAGGIAGESDGMIDDCHADVAVSAGSPMDAGQLGGIAGISRIHGIVQRSSSTGSVWAGEDAGGLVGYNQSGVVERSMSTAAVAGDWLIGGLVGNAGSSSVIRDSYFDGSVSARSYVGGVVGISHWATIENVWVRARIPPASYAGAVVGHRVDGTVADAFYDSATGYPGVGSGAAAGTALTVDQMRRAASYTGFDFATPLWTIDEGVDFPRLAWE